MKKFYFIGIGGSAMGSLAVGLKKSGHQVFGSDVGIYPPMSDILNENGIQYFSGYLENNIKDHFAGAQIVVGNAISRGNPELEFALNHKLELVTMPEVVRKYLIGQNNSIVITGTHGKTTTSSLAAWLLEVAGMNPGFFIGGVPRNFGVGCRTASSESEYFITEGDEYDTAFWDKRSKFLSYRPTIGIINNIEFDHADIFLNLGAIKNTFSLFAKLVPQNGLLLVNSEDENVREILHHARTTIWSFGLNEEADCRACNIRTDGSLSIFDVKIHSESYSNISFPLIGEHNVRNALAVCALGRFLKIPFEIISNALATFLPPKRRLEVIYQDKQVTIIDDFAHHPTAISQTLSALRRTAKGRLIACFEPRSNTSTRKIFEQEFIEALSLADVIYLGKLNRPERYSVDERLSLENVCMELRNRGKVSWFEPNNDSDSSSIWSEKSALQLSEMLQTNDVCVILSNGDFGGLRKILPKLISNNS